MIYPLYTLHKTTPGWVMDFVYFAQTRTLRSTNNPQPPNQTQQNPTSLPTLTQSLPLTTFTSFSLTPINQIFLSKILQTIHNLFIFYSYNHSIIYTEIVKILSPKIFVTQMGVTIDLRNTHKGDKKF